MYLRGVTAFLLFSLVSSLALSAEPVALEPTRALRHPYLLFNAEDIPAIRTQAQDENRYDAYLSSHEFWLNIKRRADQALDIDVSAIEEPAVDRWPGHVRDIYATASILAFAYIVTEEDSYAAKAKEFALHYAAWSQWAHPKTSRKLGFATGAVVNEVALAYDMLYDVLSDDERATLRDALLEKGLKELHAGYISKDPLLTFHNNSLMMAWDGFLHGTLAVYSDTKDPLPRECLGLALEWFEQVLEWGKEDGGWHEGLNYATHSIRGAAMTCEAMKRLFGRDYYTHPFIQQCPAFFLYFIAPNGHTVDFNDSHAVDTWPALIHFANVSGDRCTYGLFNQFRLLWRSGPQQPHDLFTFVHWRPDTQPEWPPPLPASRAFPNVGWVALRDRWDATGTLLALKSGQPKWSHEHADGNHFVLNYQGAWLITDNGYSSRSSYPAANYQWCTGGHNTVILDMDWDELEQKGSEIITKKMKDYHPWASQMDGQGYAHLRAISSAEDRAERFAELPELAATFKRGHIRSFLTTDFFDYVVADAHELYHDRFPVQRFDRHVLFDKLGTCFVILDDLASDQPRWWDSILHTNGVFHASGDFQADETERLITVTVDKGSVLNRGAVLDIHVLKPTAPQITVRRWWGDDQPDAEKMNNIYGPFVSIRAAKKLTETHFVTLLRPRPRYTEADDPAADPMPYDDPATVRHLSGTGWVGGEVTHGDARAIYLCHLDAAAANMEPEGITTDAALAAIRFAGSTLDAAALIGARLLRTGETVVLEASKPLDALLRWTDSAVEGRVKVEAPCHLLLHVGPATIAGVTLNGEAIPFSRPEGQRSVRIPLSSSGELTLSFQR